MNWKSVLTALAVAVVFSVLFLPGAFGRQGIFLRLEDQIYDFLLRIRAYNRERKNDDIVFLDVDDNAIAYSGEFPWPRSIIADALLRLKEYGARAAIFDIEYIDRGPQGVDSNYLDYGLPSDFVNSFSGIKEDARDLFYAIKTGSITRAEMDEIADYFIENIDETEDNLFKKAQSVARENDMYLFSASALMGKSWATLNLREDMLQDQNQIARRPMAEELFSYPIKASTRAFKGKYVDILPALEGFSRVAEGAGFTNVEIDSDGTRRRIDLAQNVFDHWYLQLAFSPLAGHMGNPEIELSNRLLVIKNINMPGSDVTEMSIPLDGNGRMLLDWPRDDYDGTFSHKSFADFSQMERIESELEADSRALTSFDFYEFHEFNRSDEYMAQMPFIIRELVNMFNLIYSSKNAALDNCSDELFLDYLYYRGLSHDLIREIIEIDPAARVLALVPLIMEDYPENAASFDEKGAELERLLERIKINLDKYEQLSGELGSAVQDKFCILGRVDTGTTDYGANPFHGKYINVGTHGVVLDMILSGVFINPVFVGWLILFNLAFVFLFFLASSKFPPVPRAVSGFIITVLVAVASALIFRYTGIFFNPLLTLLSMISAVIIREIISYAGSEREKQFIRKAFSTYVSDDVVKEIIADPSRLQLGGTKRHMSAIFTDVQGFSSISEQLDPEHLVSLLNRYLTFMSDAILEEKGTIDKYEGDAIIAFFGAPMPLPDHALRACQSAIAIKKIERDLNRKIMEENLSPKPLVTRIGINTGSMVAGNMGTGNKMNYTIMGNAVNLASRLEGVNKQYGTWILASEDTVKETNGRILTRKLDRVRVVGIDEPVRLHELIDVMDYAQDEEKKMVEIFHQALDLYEERKWEAAMEGFREAGEIEDGGPSSIYMRRCKTYIVYPPPDDWDGINNLTEK